MSLLKLIHAPKAPFLITFLVSWGLVGGGVILAETLHLAACPLCILQRAVYLVLGLIALLGLPVARGFFGRFLALLMALIAGAGLGLAVFQTYIQHNPLTASCSAAIPWYEKLADWFGEMAPWLFRASGLCSDPQWKFLSLSIAEWSVLAFAGLLGIALWTVFRRR